MANNSGTTVLIVLGVVIVVGGGVAIWYFSTQTPTALLDTAKKDTVSSQKAQSNLKKATADANANPNDLAIKAALDVAQKAAKDAIAKAAASGSKASGSAGSGGGGSAGSGGNANNANKNIANPKLTDNGDGTSSDSKGNIYNNSDGSYVGTKNANGDIDYANGTTLETSTGNLYAAPPNQDTIMCSNVQSVNTDGTVDRNDGSTLDTVSGILYNSDDTIKATGVQSVNEDGTVDMEGGYTLDTKTNTLYDSNDNVVATDVTNFDQNSGVVTYVGGNTETMQQIDNGETEDTSNSNNNTVDVSDPNSPNYDPSNPNYNSMDDSSSEDYVPTVDNGGVTQDTSDGFIGSMKYKPMRIHLKAV